MKLDIKLSVGNSKIGEVELVNYSLKRSNSLNLFLEENLINLNNEMFTYYFNNQSKKYRAKSFYYLLVEFVSFFENSLFGDFTNNELKFKEYIYSNFVKDLRIN